MRGPPNYSVRGGARARLDGVVTWTTRLARPAACVDSRAPRQRIRGTPRQGTRLEAVEPQAERMKGLRVKPGNGFKKD
jgi:hypothetical protein